MSRAHRRERLAIHSKCRSKVEHCVTFSPRLPLTHIGCLFATMSNAKVSFSVTDGIEPLDACLLTPQRKKVEARVEVYMGGA